MTAAAARRRDHIAWVSSVRRMMAHRQNPIIRAFAFAWDGSVEGLRRFRDGLDGWAEPTSIRDEAEDFLEDLESTLLER